MNKRLLVGLLLAGSAFGERVTMRSVANKIEDHTRAGSFVVPASEQTNCSGTANTMGQSTVATANCQTTGTPARAVPISTGYVSVYNQLEAGGTTYLIYCSRRWGGSMCLPIIVDTTVEVEVKGTDVTIYGRLGGNMGKQVKAKHKLLDMRPTAEAKLLQ